MLSQRPPCTVDVTTCSGGVIHGPQMRRFRILFKTQNNYISGTKGILEPNVCNLLSFYTIYLRCGSLSVASCSISISMSLKFFSLLIINFSPVRMSVCGFFHSSFCVHLAASLTLFRVLESLFSARWWVKGSCGRQSRAHGGHAPLKCFGLV